MSATGKRGARRRAAGFTLLELLVALAIMALGAGIAFPAIERRLSRGGHDAARLDIMLALTEARADAIAHGVPTRLSLAGGALQSSAGRAAVSLPDGVGVRWPDRGFVFYPDESADGGTGEVDSGHFTTRFAVDPATGRLAFPS
jgi:prepilin-type N-terminal cleavage/methylation domain-containing protein